MKHTWRVNDAALVQKGLRRCKNCGGQNDRDVREEICRVEAVTPAGDPVVRIDSDLKIEAEALYVGRFIKTYFGSLVFRARQEGD